MKSAGRIIFLVIALGIAGGSLINAQRGDRGMRGMKTDTLRRPGDRMMMGHMRMRPDSITSDMMRNHMRQMMRMRDEMWFGHRGLGMRPGYGRGPGFGMRPEYGRGPGFGYRDNPGFARNNHPGRLQDIPNLTDKQKKDIADLQQKQQAEMKKFREDTQSKMSEMRESFRNKVKDMLTDDQKKYLEVNPKTGSKARI